ncbi:hypothetical protein VT06_13315 [Arsukibacterium sp. MJ3]|uniref:hypothetical protein n=1 Tax=Arsukibacterium sp. MJ3 TaxID=1632859 RepID=UPI000627061D|nr:hypothetical protein [Arsukibacterium sp. MJ3]KKO48088.1 hypothetical protein VT06_13315 [Arsukibacterium sp. MJ3]
MQQHLHRQPLDLASILRYAKEDIVDIAAPLGVDAVALLAKLPNHSVLLRGNAVPVIAKRYQGCCSVRYYLNYTANGQAWPFFRFRTFKDGGLTADFNGLRWLARQPQQLTSSASLAKKEVVLATTDNNLSLGCSEQAYEKQRAVYFAILQNAFAKASAVEPQQPYLQQRLGGHVTAALLNRLKMRWYNHKILLPIERLGGDVVGFQTIDPALASDNKRNVVAFTGAMKGSFVRVTPVRGLQFYPILFCEGIITALTLALVWPGEIRAVLSCNNYGHCRKHLNERVYFAHDMDVYKPKVGNVGLNNALVAAQPDDYFMTPQFLSIHGKEQPSDFNDMLRLYGINVLQQAMEQVWQAKTTAQNLS